MIKTQEQKDLELQKEINRIITIEDIVNSTMKQEGLEFELFYNKDIKSWYLQVDALQFIQSSYDVNYVLTKLNVQHPSNIGLSYLYGKHMYLKVTYSWMESLVPSLNRIVI